jgi:glutamine cyclotransferase
MAAAAMQPRKLSWADLSGILPASDVQNSNAVLNGIAYGLRRPALLDWLWPTYFEIKIVPRKEISSSNSPGNS